MKLPAGTAAVAVAVLRRISSQAPGLIFTAALLAVAVGFSWISAPLGLIVPGTLVLALMIGWRFLGKDEVQRPRQ